LSGEGGYWRTVELRRRKQRQWTRTQDNDSAAPALAADSTRRRQRPEGRGVTAGYPAVRSPARAATAGRVAAAEELQGPDEGDVEGGRVEPAKVRRQTAAQAAMATEIRCRGEVERRRRLSAGRPGSCGDDHCTEALRRWRKLRPTGGLRGRLLRPRTGREGRA
jgi:hypothetical protein